MNTRLQELMALMMIGDGVLAAARPREHCLIWLRGPETGSTWSSGSRTGRNSHARLVSRRSAFGLWWAFQQRPQHWPGAYKGGACLTRTKDPPKS